MKFVVYTLAYGEQYRKWAAYLADTLRRRGGYRGDIVIFADGPVDTKVAEVRSTEPYWEELFPEHFLNCCFSRIPMGRALLAEGYEGMFYCDADCLTIRPLQRLFERMNDRLLVTWDKQPKPMGQSRHHRGFLNLAERTSELPSLNAGTFLGRAEVLADLFPEYERICREDNFGVLDNRACLEQSALNAWCLRNPGRWELLPRGWIWGADTPQPTDKAVILHFLVENKAQLLERTYRGL